MKKIIHVFNVLAVVLFVSLTLVTPVKADNIVNSNEENYASVMPKNEVLVEGDTIIIKDYEGIFTSESLESTRTGIQPRSIAAWILVGKATIKFITGVIGSCGSIQYVTGHDICRTVIKYLTNPPGINVTYQYNLNARYIKGYIPGCQPQHSGPCNAGYWEYKVSRS